jgi:hypothetical protein|tara:strand:- start:444 stop:770 length:327 start_codon:yes stop_codon:yes gene_type:complete
MAQDFERHLDRVTGTSPVTVFTSDSDDTVVGIRCANVSASSINVDVYIVNGAANFYLIKSAPIPIGSALELIDGGSKIIMQNGDALTVVSDTAASLDTVISRIDAISV